MPSTLGYWDGTNWTDHVAPGPLQQPARVEDHSTLVGAGFVTAIFIPIIGFIIGIVLLTKPNKAGAGIGCMVVAIIACFVWVQLLYTPSPGSSGY